MGITAQNTINNRIVNYASRPLSGIICFQQAYNRSERAERDLSRPLSRIICFQPYPSRPSKYAALRGLLRRKIKYVLRRQALFFKYMRNPSIYAVRRKMRVALLLSVSIPE